MRSLLIHFLKLNFQHRATAVLDARSGIVTSSRIVLWEMFSRRAQPRDGFNDGVMVSVWKVVWEAPAPEWAYMLR